MALILAGCGGPSAEHGEADRQRSATVRATEVTAATVKDEEEVVGAVEAAQKASLAAKVTGVVEAIRVAPGSRVTRGEVLATLDAREIKARLDQAEAAREQAQRDFARVDRLLRSGASTQADFDAANTRLRTAEAGLVEARTMMQHTSIVAPFDGVVNRKLTEVGDLATPGRPLFEMENSSLLRFECEVPEALVDRLSLGANLPVRIDAAAADLTGTVTEIAPSASAGSRTFLVKMDLPPADRVRPGQFGRARVPVAERPAVLIPSSAVTARGQLDTVFVVRDGRAILRVVRTAGSADGLREIVGGLDPGEIVVTEGAALLEDGASVEVQP
jgi:RND family efflux transporter MFP subunit